MQVETRESSITRKDLFRSLIIGGIIGIIAGCPLGWFAHQLYSQQRSAQVLLCRQKNVGAPNLEQLCGSTY